jgi:20S proteasome alpha/beta subunit
MDGLLDRNNSEVKLWGINRLSCATFSGLAGDGLALIRECRRHSSAFESAYECVPSPRALAARIGEEQHEATIRGGT